MIRPPNYFRRAKTTSEVVGNDYNWEFSEVNSVPLHFLSENFVDVLMPVICLSISPNLWVWVLQKVNVPVFGERHKDVCLTKLCINSDASQTNLKHWVFEEQIPEL